MTKKKKKMKNSTSAEPIFGQNKKLTQASILSIHIWPISTELSTIIFRGRGLCLKLNLLIEYCIKKRRKGNVLFYQCHLSFSFP